MTGVELQEIPQIIIIYEIWLQPTSKRFLRELDEALGGNYLYYILQCLRVPVLVTQGLNKESALGGNGVLSE